MPLAYLNAVIPLISEQGRDSILTQRADGKKPGACLEPRSGHKLWAKHTGAHHLSLGDYFPEADLVEGLIIIISSLEFGDGLLCKM